MVKLDNFGVLNLCSNFTFLTCEESVRFRLTCDNLVQFFSDVKKWYQLFKNVQNWYLIFTCVSDKFWNITYARFNLSYDFVSTHRVSFTAYMSVNLCKYSVLFVGQRETVQARSDAEKRVNWSGPLQFAYRMVF